MIHCMSIVGSVKPPSVACKNSFDGLLRACFSHRTPCLSLKNWSPNVTFVSGISLAIFYVGEFLLTLIETAACKMFLDYP